jgi:heme/copper-type cytochrome/quinol oxidase subunit 2
MGIARIVRGLRATEDRVGSAPSYDGCMWSWILTGLIVLFVAGVALWLFRSLRRWPQSAPRDPDTKQAEARLWTPRGGGDM